jgi:hypothetical protein
LTNDFELLNPLTAVFGHIDIPNGVHGDAVRLVELTWEVTDAAAEARQDLAGLTVNDFDL